MVYFCSLLKDAFSNSNYKPSNEWMIVDNERERVYGEIKENHEKLSQGSRSPNRYCNRPSHGCKSEAVAEWTELFGKMFIGVVWGYRRIMNTVGSFHRSLFNDAFRIVTISC
jgi:hypothetical protein